MYIQCSYELFFSTHRYFSNEQNMKVALATKWKKSGKSTKMALDDYLMVS
jgi:hypothetical protein